MLLYQDFIDNGCFVHTFEHTTMLEEIRGLCELRCREAFGERFTALGRYHTMNVPKEEHDSFQYSLFEELNQKKLHHDLVRDNLTFFTQLVGPDIDVQTQTYLRISRPGVQEDNIGIHRDTDYGNSAYEISVTMPLIDQEKGAGLRVVPGSHLFKEHNVQQVDRADVERGSDKNKMGFLYAPKIPVQLNEEQLRCYDLKFGQGLGFSLGLLHGQVANTSNMTRWSIDFRIKNSFHPLSKNLKAGYYSSFRQGMVTTVGGRYYQNNQTEIDDLRVSDPHTYG